MVGRNCVRNEVKECIAKETTRGKAEENLEEGGVLCCIGDGDEEEDDKGSGTDEGGGA